MKGICDAHFALFILHYLPFTVVHWVLTVCSARWVYEYEEDAIALLKISVYLSVGRRHIILSRVELLILGHFWLPKQQTFHVTPCPACKRWGREVIAALWLTLITRPSPTVCWEPCVNHFAYLYNNQQKWALELFPEDQGLLVISVISVVWVRVPPDTEAYALHVSVLLPVKWQKS